MSSYHFTIIAIIIGSGKWEDTKSSDGTHARKERRHQCRCPRKNVLCAAKSSGTSKTNSRRAKNVFCDTEFFIGCLTSDVRKDGGEKKQQAGGAKVIAYLVDLLAR